MTCDWFSSFREHVLESIFKVYSYSLLIPCDANLTHMTDAHISYFCFAPHCQKKYPLQQPPTPTLRRTTATTAGAHQNSPPKLNPFTTAGALPPGGAHAARPRQHGRRLARRREAPRPLCRHECLPVCGRLGSECGGRGRLEEWQKWGWKSGEIYQKNYPEIYVHQISYNPLRIQNYNVKFQSQNSNSKSYPEIYISNHTSKMLQNYIRICGHQGQEDGCGHWRGGVSCMWVLGGGQLCAVGQRLMGGKGQEDGCGCSRIQMLNDDSNVQKFKKHRKELFPIILFRIDLACFRFFEHPKQYLHGCGSSSQPALSQIPDASFSSI